MIKERPPLGIAGALRLEPVDRDELALFEPEDQEGAPEGQKVGLLLFPSVVVLLDLHHTVASKAFLLATKATVGHLPEVVLQA